MIRLEVGQAIVDPEGNVSTVTDIYRVYQIREHETNYIKTTEQRHVDSGYWTVIPKDTTPDQVKALVHLMRKQ